MVYFMRRLVNILFVVSAHAVTGKQSFRFAVANGDAGCFDRLIIGKTLGDLGVQIKQLFKQVSLGVEAIGGEDGFVEGGMGMYRQREDFARTAPSGHQPPPPVRCRPSLGAWGQCRGAGSCRPLRKAIRQP